MALALYRRYRPDTFDGIIGQDQVTVPLSKALDEGKLTHAYLFSGPRGCGKTSSARILARCINCEKGPTSHPCGECESCKDLATGGPGSIDVVEIDAASHNGVDDARELRERAGFAPARDRYKIFILDEAHMVTQQGFNALLKIVEEPPEHVMFIFATTEPDKVIGTIRSRTHHYPFRLVPLEVMGPYLERICEEEKISPDHGVLKLAMRAGGGSVRDTLSVLDQLMVGSVEGVISYGAAVALLGFTPDALIGQAIQAVIDKDGQSLFEVVQKVIVGGFDPRRFVEDLLSRVRDLIVLLLAGERAEAVLSDDSAAEDVGALHRQAQALGLPSLTSIAEIMNDALGTMAGAVSPRMRLELLAAKLLASRENVQIPLANMQAATGVATTHGSQRQGAAQPNNSEQGFVGSHRRNQREQSQQMAQAAERIISENTENTENTEKFKTEPQAQITAQNEMSAHSDAANEDTRIEYPQPVDNTTVNERWDTLVAQLPPDVREYVVRSKVPSVSVLSGNNGKIRLAMTFDSALSQHAFALAVSSDENYNGEKAANVVLNAVRSAMGQHVMIAPTGVAANGEKVESTKRMSSEQLAQVKKQIALAKAGLAAAGLANAIGGKPGANHSATQHGSEPKQHNTTSSEGQSDDDDSSHRGIKGAGGSAERSMPSKESGKSKDQEPAVSVTTDSTNNVVTDIDATDIVEVNAPEAFSRQRVEETSAAQPLVSNWAVAAASFSPAFQDDDPWNQPIPFEASEAGATQRNAGATQPSEAATGIRRAHTSRGVDNAETGNLSPSETSGKSYSTASRSLNEPQTQTDEYASTSHTQTDTVDDPWVHQVTQGTAEHTEHTEHGRTEHEHQAAQSEYDEYSMSDQSLAGATTLDKDELMKIFEVKNVEEFEADDPRNPRNLATNTKHQEG